MIYDSHAHHTISLKERIADMTSDNQAHNSEEEIPFELARFLPPAHTSLKEKLTPDQLYGLVKDIPSTTLSRLCSQAQIEWGVTMSTTSMCRLLKQYGIPHKSKGRAEVVNVRMLLVA